MKPYNATNLTERTDKKYMKTDFKVYKRKIDIYLRNFRDKRFYYECSSYAYKTCKEAKKAYCIQNGLDESQVKITFSK